MLNSIRNAFKAGGIKNVFRKTFYKTIYKFNNLLTRISLKLSRIKDPLNKSERKEKIIISMTSYKPRFEGICDCIKSLCVQSYKPDRICIFFGNDVNKDDLTFEMIQMEKYGVEYIFNGDENLKPHKKYYYSLQMFPNDIIITVDDDVLYPKNWLKKFINVHNKYPNSVCAWRLHKMTFSSGKLNPYSMWIDEYRGSKKPMYSLFPTGVGGVLYPSGCFVRDVLNKDVFMQICANADDVWLKIMYTLNDVKTVWVPNFQIDFCETRDSQKVALSSTNVRENRNDEFIANVMKEYNIDPMIFFRDEVKL